MESPHVERYRPHILISGAEEPSGTGHLPDLTISPVKG